MTGFPGGEWEEQGLQEEGWVGEGLYLKHGVFWEGTGYGMKSLFMMQASQGNIVCWEVFGEGVVGLSSVHAGQT